MVLPPVESKNGHQVRGKRGRLLVSLQHLLEKHGRERVGGGPMVSYKTMQNRENVLYPAFRYMYDSKYKITDIKKFKEKHLQHIIRHWELDLNLDASTIQVNFSILNVFCSWLNKQSMVKPLKCYLEDADKAVRTYIATEDISWTGRGIDTKEKINEVFEVDPRVGYQLELQWAFGLRIKESFLFNLTYLNEKTCLEVFKGTKGRRSRIVHILTDDQQRLLDEYALYCNQTTGSLIPRNMKLYQWRNVFNRVMRQCGITKKENGITAHGLRHEYAQNRYKALTGNETRIRSIALNHKVTQTDPELAKMARKVITNEVGHSRRQITNAYLGSEYSHRSP